MWRWTANLAINDDIASFNRIRRNKITQTILVVVFTSLGTFVAIPRTFIVLAEDNERRAFIIMCKPSFTSCK